MISLGEGAFKSRAGECGGDVEEEFGGKAPQEAPCQKWDTIWPRGRVVAVVDGIFDVFAANFPMVLLGWESGVAVAALAVWT